MAMDFTTNTIWNEMEGQFVDAPPAMLKILRAYFKARGAFLKHVRDEHDQTDPQSIEIYLSLLGAWDKQIKELSPWQNALWILHRGLSLN
jgi:hypothetical protein